VLRKYALERARVTHVPRAQAQVRMLNVGEFLFGANHRRDVIPGIQ
jgi:hypothetical protein